MLGLDDTVRPFLSLQGLTLQSLPFRRRKRGQFLWSINGTDPMVEP